VRSNAVDIAVEAASRLLADKIDAKADAGLFKASLDDVKSRLN
jgi:F-type H+-transporting ATPase subunit b